MAGTLPKSIRERPIYVAVLVSASVLCWGLTLGAAALDLGPRSAADTASASQMAGQAAEQARTEYDAAHQAAIAARSKFAAAQADLDAALESQLARHAALPEIEPPPTPAEQRRRELEEQLARLADRRSLLLQSMTAEHPQIKQIDSELLHLQRLAGQAPGTRRATSRGARPAPADSAALALARQQRAAQYEQLAAAEQAERSALTLWTNAQEHLGEPPSSMGADHGRSVFWLTLVVTAAAALVGMFAAGLDPLVHAVFRSASEVSRVLGIPVLGALGESNHAVVRPKSNLRFRLVRAGGEVGVAAFLVAAGLALAADQAIAKTFVTDPLLGLRLAAETTLGHASGTSTAAR